VFTLAARQRETGRGRCDDHSTFVGERDAGMMRARARPAERPLDRVMTDTLPDRLSVDPQSPHYDADVLQRDVGVRFNGVEKTNVEEYCVSEGWIRVAAGKALDRQGRPLTIKLKGTVEPYFRDNKVSP
jgi:hypothetical protein